MVNKVKLNEKIVSLRKKKGLSQQDLAEALDVSRQAVSRWETGVAVPSSENLKFIGNLFDVSLDYLLADDVELEQESGVADTRKRKDENRKKRKRILIIKIIVVFFLFFQIVFIGMWFGSKGGSIQIDDLNREEVESPIEDGFNLYLEFKS